MVMELVVTCAAVAAAFVVFSYGVYALLDVYGNNRRLTSLQIASAVCVAPIWVGIPVVFGFSSTTTVVLAITILALGWVMRPIWLYLSPRGAYYPSLRQLMLTMWVSWKA